MDDITLFTEHLLLKKIENIMLEEKQYDIPVEHIFSGGVYIRQVFNPKGSLIMGKRHRHETCNILLSGELSIYMGKDIPVNKIKGPFLFTSKPNTKKFIYCHEDAIFITIHPTNETDLEKIEKEFIISEEEYELLIKGEKS
jgi:hypothetical protein